MSNVILTVDEWHSAGNRALNDAIELMREIDAAIDSALDEAGVRGEARKAIKDDIDDGSMKSEATMTAWTLARSALQERGIVRVIRGSVGHWERAA